MAVKSSGYHDNLFQASLSALSFLEEPKDNEWIVDTVLNNVSIYSKESNGSCTVPTSAETFRELFLDNSIRREWDLQFIKGSEIDILDEFTRTVLFTIHSLNSNLTDDYNLFLIESSFREDNGSILIISTSIPPKKPLLNMAELLFFALRCAPINSKECRATYISASAGEWFSPKSATCIVQLSEYIKTHSDVLSIAETRAKRIWNTYQHPSWAWKCLSLKNKDEESNIDNTLKRAFNITRKAIDGKDGWIKWGKIHGMEIRIKSLEDLPITTLFKGETTINASPMDILDAYMNLRGEWDPFYEHGRILQQLQGVSIDCSEIRLYHTSPNSWFFCCNSPRQLIIGTRTVHGDDGSIWIIQSSVNHPHSQKLPGYVRARLHIGAIVIQGKSPCQVTSVIGYDPSGWRSKTYTNSDSINQVLCIDLIKKYLESKPSSFIGHSPDAARQYYFEKLDRAILLAAEAALPNARGWVFHSKSNNVDIYTAKFGEHNGSKGVGIIPASLNTVFTVFTDNERRGEFDDLWDYSRLIEEVDSVTRITHISLKSAWPATPRDMVVIGKSIVNSTDGSLLIISCSVEHPKVPARASHIRGILIFGATIFKPVDNSNTEVTYISLMDSKGSVPTFLVNLASIQAPLIINNARLFISKNPEYRNKPVHEVLKTADQIANFVRSNDTKLNDPLLAKSNSKTAPHEFLVFLEQKRREALVELTGVTEQNWMFIKRLNDVDVYSRVDGKTFFTKGIGIVNYSSRILHRVLVDLPHRSKWDKSFKGGRILQDYGNYLFSVICWYSTPWPLAHREFTLLSKSFINDDGSILIMNVSYPFSEIPTADNHIRANCISYVYIQPLLEDRSLLTYIVAIDPKVSIPGWLIRDDSFQQSLVVDNIRHFIQEEYSRLSNEVELFYSKPVKIEKRLAPKLISWDVSTLPGVAEFISLSHFERGMMILKHMINKNPAPLEVGRLCIKVVSISNNLPKKKILMCQLELGAEIRETSTRSSAVSIKFDEDFSFSVFDINSIFRFSLVTLDHQLLCEVLIPLLDLDPRTTILQNFQLNGISVDLQFSLLTFPLFQSIVGGHNLMLQNESYHPILERDFHEDYSPDLFVANAQRFIDVFSPLKLLVQSFWNIIRWKTNYLTLLIIFVLIFFYLTSFSYSLFLFSIQFFLQDFSFHFF